MDIEVNGGVGTVTIVLPEKTGVFAEINGGLGSINAYGLTRNGRTFNNEAYRHTPHTIEIEINGGIGEVNLEMEKNNLSR